MTRFQLAKGKIHLQKGNGDWPACGKVDASPLFAVKVTKKIEDVTCRSCKRTHYHNNYLKARYKK